ncbi:MAG: STAS domain-containing protein [Candidatus Hydrogenedentes bacterium]|nr:STAS domain-containing protein [Candidatus Hydrogenedentota bacterium]
MDFTKISHGLTTIFKVRGSLDSESDEVLNLKMAILDELKSGNKKNIILNFEQVELIDVLSIAHLLECLRIVRKRGGDLKLVNPNTFVQQVLHEHSVSHFFEIYPTESQAMVSSRKVA